MVRIISGTKKNYKLEVPPNITRPLTDRIKSSIFDLIKDFLQDARVLDLFAGSGAFGIEALSRGALYTHFIEIDQNAGDIIELNLKKTGFTDKANISISDGIEFLKTCDEKFTIIFLDPPFALPDKELLLKDAIKRLDHNGLIVLRYPTKETELGKHSKIGKIERVYEKKYGESMVAFYRN